MSTERPGTYVESGTLPGSVYWEDPIDSLTTHTHAESGILLGSIHRTDSIALLDQDIDLSTRWDLDLASNPGSVSFPLSASLHGETINTQNIFGHGPIQLDSPMTLANPAIDNLPAILSMPTSIMLPENSHQDGTAGPRAGPGDPAMPPPRADVDAEAHLAVDNDRALPAAIPTDAASTTVQPQTLERLLPRCETLSNQSRLSEHLAQEHTRPHECPQCSRRFQTAKDRDRHVRTVHRAALSLPSDGVWICGEENCKRMRKPFSRRDNYLKHLREVHGTKGQGSEGVQGRGSGSEDDRDPVPGEDETTVPGTAGGDCDRRKGKRKLDDLDEGLDELSRGELLRLLLQARQKCRKLEDELQENRRRYETREDTWLRLLAARLEDSG